jgi:hypothetical protein
MDFGWTLLHAPDDECTAVESVDPGFSGSTTDFTETTDQEAIGVSDPCHPWLRIPVWVVGASCVAD